LGRLSLAFATALTLSALTASWAEAAPRRGVVRELPVKVERFAYTTHDGKQSYALLLLPGWYGPSRHPAIPLVISPHGRNTTPETAAKRWYDLPTRGRFAVVLPAGQGRILQLYSWGYPGQISDLARMPTLASQAFPWLHYLRKHVYAIGASMGAQEVLLLLAKHPRMLAGVIAFDPATDLANRYYEFPDITFGRQDQQRARIEVGGTPKQVPQAYAVRSPISYVRRIAFSNVPVQLWWSIKDKVIVNQAQQAGRFYQQIKLINPAAPVVPYVGTWQHTGEVSAVYQLPAALARIGLLPASWLVHNPYHPTANGGHPTLLTVGRRATDSEVAHMVEQAQVEQAARLENDRGLVSGNWRWASIALAAVLGGLLLAGVVAATWRHRRPRAPGHNGRPSKTPTRTPTDGHRPMVIRGPNSR
jgi:pimeloyl-ACP methyl ester carboxylesterase